MILFLLRLRRFVRFKSFNKKFSTNKVLKLNLGCGTDYKNGWINLDNNSDNNIKKLDINWDLRKGIPFENETIDFIFNEHFLEHLTVEESEYFLKECKRVLKKNGVLRISMPDLKQLINDYLNENWKEDNKLFFEKFGFNFLKTRAEWLNINFHSWGHKWLYDKEELERRLKSVGFDNYCFCELNKSDYSELSNLETRNESMLIVEVTK